MQRKLDIYYSVLSGHIRFLSKMFETEDYRSLPKDVDVA